jgi:hypothetical protein
MHNTAIAYTWTSDASTARTNGIWNARPPHWGRRNWREPLLSFNSTRQPAPPRSETANEAAYLELPFTWTPSQRFDHGQVREYQLGLGSGRVALLERVGGTGWALTIEHRQHRTERGMFATPHDALMVLVAEYVLQRFDGRGPDRAPMSTQPMIGNGNAARVSIPSTSA